MVDTVRKFCLILTRGWGKEDLRCLVVVQLVGCSIGGMWSRNGCRRGGRAEQEVLSIGRTCLVRYLAE